jgi:hypothetical protein
MPSETVVRDSPAKAAHYGAGVSKLSRPWRGSWARSRFGNVPDRDSGLSAAKYSGTSGSGKRVVS